MKSGGKKKKNAIVACYRRVPSGAALPLSIFGTNKNEDFAAGMGSGWVGLGGGRGSVELRSLERVIVSATVDDVRAH